MTVQMEFSSRNQYPLIVSKYADLVLKYNKKTMKNNVSITAIFRTQFLTHNNIAIFKL